jgi:hypothetical protein
MKKASIVTTEMKGKRAGTSQLDQQQEIEILLKHTVTDAPLLRRPKVNVHPSRKQWKPRPRRIIPTEETTATEEKSITQEPYELANACTNEYNKLDTKAPSGVFGHSRGGYVEPG